MKNHSSWGLILFLSVLVLIITPYFWVACWDGSCHAYFEYTLLNPIIAILGLFHALNWIQIFIKLIISITLFYLFKINSLKSKETIISFSIVIIFLFSTTLFLYYFVNPTGRLERFYRSVKVGMTASNIDHLANSIIPDLPRSSMAEDNCVIYGYNPAEMERTYNPGLFGMWLGTRVCFDNRIVKTINFPY